MSKFFIEACFVTFLGFAWPAGAVVICCENCAGTINIDTGAVWEGCADVQSGEVGTTYCRTWITYDSQGQPQHWDCQGYGDYCRGNFSDCPGCVAGMRIERQQSIELFARVSPAVAGVKRRAA